MFSKYSVILVVAGLAGCATQSPEFAVNRPLSVEGNQLINVTFGAPVCGRAQTPFCLSSREAAIAERDVCRNNCTNEGCPDDPDSCSTCLLRCGTIPPPCPVEEILAECTDCNDEIIDMVKTCKIPNIIPPNQPPTINTVVPCDAEGWEEIGECSACWNQRNPGLHPDATGIGIVLPPSSLIGRTHCSCEGVPDGGWSSWCRVPNEAPKLVRD